ncbi:hypothetical protein KOI40_03045 [Aestuariicella sp. G3-2]|nr:hypothetical protein [Aestuariicella albida]
MGQVITLGDIDWQITRSSKKSGYQWILKNLDEGFVVLMKSFYAEETHNASHLKIEVTPQCIYEHTPKSLCERLRSIASIFATQLLENGIAAHLAADLKGFTVPKDFECRLVTKAKRQFRVNNISNVQVSLNEIATVYGNGQTYTFGSASSLQFCLYEKEQEAIKSDKIDFWEKVWSKVPSVDDVCTPEYQHGDRVHRFEMRFHHSVIREFCNASVNQKTGEMLVINDFEQLSEHLTALWHYALNNFRLQHSASYIDPVWQLLIEDITIYPPAPDWFYKRGKKPPTQNSRRNVAFWLGNAIKLMARKRFTVRYAVQYILNSGLDDDLADYFGVFQFGYHDELRQCLHEFVREKMERHWLEGVAV